MTIAVYLSGGDRQFVDTEDAAYKVNQLAPGRFAWRKYPDQINLELVRVRLSEAKKPSNNSYLQGSHSDGWMLTENGLKFARKAARNISAEVQTRTPRNRTERRQFASERRRLLETEAYRKFQSGKLTDITQRDAEIFFYVDDYVIGKSRERKITRLVTMFAEDDILSKLTKAVAKTLIFRGAPSKNGNSST